MTQLSDAARLTADLVAVDTVNPLLVPGAPGEPGAGRAAALVACRDADRAGIRGEIVVAAVADEEHGSIGVQDVLRHVHPDAAVVTEPTELAIVTAHKGFVWVEIEVLGRAAHGSRPHLGVDAIRKMGPVLAAVGAWDDRLQQRAPHALVGVPSV